MGTISIFLVPALVALAGSLVFARYGRNWGLVDKPGGRKDHAQPIPIGGGLAIYLALISGCLTAGLFPAMTAMIFAASIIVIAGFADDLLDVSPKVKFLAQAAAALVMIHGAEIELRSVGNLIGTGDIGLSVFVVPMTILAALGVINALNMSDGMDGLAGTITLVAAIAYAIAARLSGLEPQFHLLLVLAGAAAGFLLLNMRFPWRKQGRLFLGDAGSMLVGFLLCWATIDLTQGPHRPLPEICALWVIVIPLCDCVSLILRRLMAGTSPFVGDRQHLHHFLLDRGFSVSQTLGLIALASVACALIGIGGWRMGVPEPALFAAFVVLFLIYHFSMSRAFKHANSPVQRAG
jgi:UDP-GlcNAc:undecaprenyl-phosphate GlcNAc-1-phosphate transferase